MSGGTQGQLMLGSDGNLWVVKFRNNPQHRRILANEWMACHIAQSIGLTVPKCHTIAVLHQTIADDPRLNIQLGNGVSEPCREGVHFASQYIGGCIADWMADEIGLAQWSNIQNYAEFLGMFVLDRWTGNRDRRQTLFKSLLDGKRFRAVFIDHGWSFGAGDWDFGEGPLPWGKSRSVLFDPCFNWSSFEPWIRKIEAYPAEALWSIAASVPPDWYEHDIHALHNLIERLLRRRSLIRWHTFDDWTHHRGCIRDL